MRNPRDGDRYGQDVGGRRTRATLVWVATAVASVSVIALLAVGFAGVMSGSDDLEGGVPVPMATGAILPTPSVTVSSSPRPEPIVTLEDVWLVDVRTRRESPLPGRIRSVPGATHFQMSPDGTRIAFDDGTNVFVADRNGRNMRPVTLGVAPWWSPDGTKIVYVGGVRGLFLFDLRTADIERIFRGYGEIFHPNFSPDGERVLFTFARSGAHPLQLRTVAADGGRADILPLPRGAFGTYSPDGALIAYRRTDYDGGDVTKMTEDSLWVADADGTNPRSLGAWTGSMSQINPQALWPMWSPDGRRIVYERLYSRGLSIVDLASEHIVRIDAEGDPSWFDNHTLIVANSRRM